MPLGLNPVLARLPLPAFALAYLHTKRDPFNTTHIYCLPGTSPPTHLQRSTTTLSVLSSVKGGANALEFVATTNHQPIHFRIDIRSSFFQLLSRSQCLSLRKKRAQRDALGDVVVEKCKAQEHFFWKTGSGMGWAPTQPNAHVAAAADARLREQRSAPFESSSSLRDFPPNPQKRSHNHLNLCDNSHLSHLLLPYARAREASWKIVAPSLTGKNDISSCPEARRTQTVCWVRQ